MAAAPLCLPSSPHRRAPPRRLPVPFSPRAGVSAAVRRRTRFAQPLSLTQRRIATQAKTLRDGAPAAHAYVRSVRRRCHAAGWWGERGRDACERWGEMPLPHRRLVGTPAALVRSPLSLRRLSFVATPLAGNASGLPQPEAWLRPGGGRGGGGGGGGGGVGGGGGGVEV